MLYSLLVENVLTSIGGVLLAIIILLAMVTIHEFGHYVAGKILGFRINEFSVGFGPAIFKRRSKKTGELFALRVVPLGGYCAFDGEDETGEESVKKEDPEGQPFAEMTSETENTEQAQPTEEYPQPKGERFNDQAPWKRIIVLVAGATMNYLLALVLIVVMFACLGRPIYQVKKSPPAEGTTDIVYETGLREGDILLKIEGRDLYMITDYIDALQGKAKGDSVTITLIRDGAVTEEELLLAYDANFVNMSDTTRVLAALGLITVDDTGKVVRGGGLYGEHYRDGFFQTIGHSFVYSFKIGGVVLRSLGELLTGKIGLDAMGGPITTIQVTSQAATAGIGSFLNIAAFIGVNLAVFNLLPIPALDGCKVIFCLIEWIRKKPVNRKVETIIHFVGLVALFGFAILVDLLQLFR